MSRAAWRRAVLVLAGSVSALALAAPGDVSPAGFTVSLHAETGASRERVFEALLHPERWWSSRHTWSGSAANMSLAAEASGCWCERWDGNAVEHGRVVLLKRGELLRLDAALGPLQALAVRGVLTYAVAAKDGRTSVDVSYRVSGSAASQLERMAAPVDGVLDEQLRRLVRLAESGAPE